MDIVGNRKFIELPGSAVHELPPLLVRMQPQIRRLESVMEMAERLLEEEDLCPQFKLDADASHAALELKRRKMDMSVNLVDQYLGFRQQWQWGDGILEWIRQCETTFESRVDLRHVLRTDVWPHAGQSSFVMLLKDKDVDTLGVEIEKAVGLRLTFRQPPPLRCFSDQFLFFLNSAVAKTAYDTWSGLAPTPISSLPPEKFNFDVVNMSVL